MYSSLFVFFSAPVGFYKQLRLEDGVVLGLMSII